MNIKLSEILVGLNVNVTGSTDIYVTGIQLDSRKIKLGDLFVALKGTQSDGHAYIDAAISAGAKAVMCEKLPASPDPGICWMQTPHAAELTGKLASAFYGNPSEKLTIVGVTGTNGKTTVTTLLYDLFVQMGYTCGLISTVVNRIAGASVVSTHTTPDAVSLQELLFRMADAGCTHVFMEVSSHALDQFRVSGLNFSLALFTNITHDHLDYHLTFENYLKAKKKLFDGLDSGAMALVNADDRNAKYMVQSCKAPVYKFGIKSPADFKAKVLEKDFNGMLLSVDGQEAWFRLVGSFNASNLLGVYSVAFLLGHDSNTIIQAMTALETVSGRFETINGPDRLTCIVDYAHTPDALENVLRTISEIRTKNEQVITVVGCGGDRDQEKRPLMAQVASQWSDRVILTSDNPRSEDPSAIIKQMQAGVPPQHYRKVLSIADRKEAIKTAIMTASNGDIILIAGKGHERYQETQGIKHPFDDKAIAIEMFHLRNPN